MSLHVAQRVQTWHKFNSLLRLQPKDSLQLSIQTLLTVAQRVHKQGQVLAKGSSILTL